eukprot:8782600-Ditylum_brightwellii.AAC.1
MSNFKILSKYCANNPSRTNSLKLHNQDNIKQREHIELSVKTPTVSDEGKDGKEDFSHLMKIPPEDDKSSNEEETNKSDNKSD